MGYCKPLGEQIGSEYICTSSLGQYSQHDTDGSLPNHKHRLPRARGQSCNSFHAGINRLDERGLLEGDFRGEFCDPATRNNPVQNPHILRESAAAGLEAGRTSHLLVNGTLSKNLVPAVKALSTRDVMEHADAIARGIIVYAFA